MSSSFAPTAEQLRAIELFSTGESLVIEAGAGTGKTSTLVMLARSTRRRGQYVAFNRSIVEDSRSKFPSTVNCSTAHSLAYRAIAAGTPFENRMRSGKRMRSIDIANRLGIDAIRVTTSDGESKLLSSSFLAGVVMNAVMNFCKTADAEPTNYHVGLIPGLDPATGPYYVNREVAKALVKPIRRAWADLTNPEGGLPFTRSIAMSVYLKLWQLSEPRIGADFILFDEAQDANPVMVAVIAAQKHAQLVWVGDSQQQIYSFTGAVNALQNLPDANRTFLTQSFRFGPAVAEVANHVLSLIESAELRLTGFDQITSTVAPIDDPSCVLTRTNAEAVRKVLAAITEERQVHLVGGGKDIVAFCKAAVALQNGERVDHPELACFESWGEVQAYVEDDEQGGDLKLLVNLIDEFGADVIIDALDTQVPEDEADLVVSTAHKSKGREWSSVQIAGDFQEDRIATSDDEKRLLYVAVTRAQHELDIDAIPFLRDGLAPVAKPVAATTAEKAEPPAVEAKIETVETPKSDWVGKVGETINLTSVRCERAHGMTTRFGYTHLTKLVDAAGNSFKAFIDEELEVGSSYTGTARVKKHSEFNGERETELNYVRVEQVEQEEPVGVEIEAKVEQPAQESPAPAESRERLIYTWVPREYKSKLGFLLDNDGEIVERDIRRKAAEERYNSDTSYVVYDRYGMNRPTVKS